MPTTLELKEVCKSYGKEKVKVNALTGVNLKIEAGEVVLIMGPSGSGKTTLLSISGCILKPTSGKVILDGSSITNIRESSLAKIRKNKIGFIFQSFNLLPSLTAKENVMVSLNLGGKRGRKASAEAKELLEELNLKSRLKHYPDELSGGEKQRVAIARALANNSSLILADEPTANLDSKSGHSVSKLLTEIAKEHKTSVLIASHDNRIMDIADKILLLEDGIIKNVKA